MNPNFVREIGKIHRSPGRTIFVGGGVTYVPTVSFMTSFEVGKKCFSQFCFIGRHFFMSFVDVIFAYGLDLVYRWQPRRAPLRLVTMAGPSMYAASLMASWRIKLVISRCTRRVRFNYYITCAFLLWESELIRRFFPPLCAQMDFKVFRIPPCLRNRRKRLFPVEGKFSRWPSTDWSIRVCEFPRLQQLVICLIV